jgi:phosphoribosylformylglycinamidine synthase subunit PurQ / glutaminase
MEAHALIVTGYGINCDEETQYAFQKAGAKTTIIHVNDLIADTGKLAENNILIFPGGFSYGDDTGSGNALANKIKNNMWNEIRAFVSKDTLTLGICNGFQTLVNLGLVPAFKNEYGERNVALVHNDSARYVDRWVDLSFPSNGPWTKGIDIMSAPIAHGEGKFYCAAETLSILRSNNQIAAQYALGDCCSFQSLSTNPNGSLDNIAGITNETGNVLGMMPHPERAIDFTHLPQWTMLKEELQRAGKEIPVEGPGLQLFKNAVQYFSEKEIVPY